MARGTHEMKILLRELKNDLAANMNQIVRPADVFIVPDENYIPARAKEPFIGLKDGSIGRRELAGGYLELTMEVSVVLWIRLYQDEASIMGDQSGKEIGILDFAKSIDACLDENLLGLTASGMQEAFMAAEAASRLWPDETDSRQQKILTYRYIQEVVRP